MSGRFWPVAEPTQAEYERLRGAALAGEPLSELLAWRRMQRRGLAGLIDWPSAEPAFLGSVVGARRPRWSGAEDPREAALAETYGFLLARADASAHGLKAVGE